jgi:hypothetical protein
VSVCSLTCICARKSEFDGLWVGRRACITVQKVICTQCTQTHTRPSGHQGSETKKSAKSIIQLNHVTRTCWGAGGDKKENLYKQALGFLQCDVVAQWWCGGSEVMWWLSWLKQLGDTRQRTQLSRVRIRLPPHSPERGQEIWLCIINKSQHVRRLCLSKKQLKKKSSYNKALSQKMHTRPVFRLDLDTL